MRTFQENLPLNPVCQGSNPFDRVPKANKAIEIVEGTTDIFLDINALQHVISRPNLPIMIAGDTGFLVGDNFFSS